MDPAEESNSHSPTSLPRSRMALLGRSEKPPSGPEPWPVHAPKVAADESSSSEMSRRRRKMASSAETREYVGRRGGPEPMEGLPVVWKHQAVSARFRRHQSERFGRGLGSFDAKSGEPLELRERRGTDPAEVAAGEFGHRVFSRKRRTGQRTRAPQRVTIALQVEPAIRGDAANATLALQLTQRDGHSAAKSLLDTFGTEASRRAAGRLFELFRTHGSRTESIDDSVAEAVNFRGGYAEFCRRLQVRVGPLS
jgi:hypothetical protein